MDSVQEAFWLLLTLLQRSTLGILFISWKDLVLIEVITSDVFLPQGQGTQQ